MFRIIRAQGAFRDIPDSSQSQNEVAVSVVVDCRTRYYKMKNIQYDLEMAQI